MSSPAGSQLEPEATSLAKNLYMKKLKTSAADMVKDAAARIEEIEVTDALSMVEDASVILVDIRDIRERQRTGSIPGSMHAPRGMLEFWVDPESPYHKEIFSEDKKFVFFCASGWRSALSTDTLNKMGFESAHLKGGFTAWEKAGAPVEAIEKKK